MGVWIIPPILPLLPPEFSGFSAIGEAGDPRSSAVKLHEDEGGVRDAMRRRELPVVWAGGVPRSWPELVDGELGCGECRRGEIGGGGLGGGGCSGALSRMGEGSGSLEEALVLWLSQNSIRHLVEWLGLPFCLV